jgi:hypothetical protein
LEVFAIVEELSMELIAHANMKAFQAAETALSHFKRLITRLDANWMRTGRSFESLLEEIENVIELLMRRIERVNPAVIQTNQRKKDAEKLKYDQVLKRTGWPPVK